MREATDEVHNGLAIERIMDVSMQERLVVVNLTLHSLASIDDNSRETLEYIKQEAAIKFEITMGTGGKTFKELMARINNIAKVCGWQRQKCILYKLSQRIAFKK